MSEIFTPLSEINKNRMDWKIQVRVCRKWRTASNGKIPESLEFLFVDLQGSRIHASVKKMHIARFESKVNEGDLCTVKQFSVVDRPKKFPIADSPYRIMFHATTFLGTFENSSFPRSIFNFRRFLDIIDGSIKEDDHLFDVIGTVVDINNSWMKADGTIKGIQILLEDSLSLNLECVLWEPYCHELKNYFDAVRHHNDSQVIIIQLCKANFFKGKISISNTFHATKVIVDQNLEEILEFKSKLPITTVSNSFDSSKISSSSYISVKDELLSPSTVFSTVKELKTADVPVNVWVVASISEFLYDRGWSYISCLKCKKKVKEKETKFFCDFCKKNVVGDERFKIHMNVVDGTSNATFLLWNDIAKSLIGKTAQEVWGSLIQDSGSNEGSEEGSLRDASKFDVPQPIESLIGTEYLFKVVVEDKHIQRKDSVYVVDRYSDDQEMIKMHKKINHEIFSSSSTPHKDFMDETKSVQEESCSPSHQDFKTPDNANKGKRTFDISSQDGEESSSAKLPKTA